MSREKKKDGEKNNRRDYRQCAFESAWYAVNLYLTMVYNVFTDGLFLISLSKAIAP